MNWIDILWTILTFVSALLFTCGAWAARYKLRLVNTMLTVGIILYSMEMMQTITHLNSSGYFFRMLTWVIQASYLAISVYHVWPKPWMKRGANCLNGGKIAIALMLMSCLSMLVLK
ncbi:TPA: hypothetical protein QHX51_000759 [Enterobacter asburiae]|jgi:hypothetical protein|uniref:hypothetical protein n=1 Tax=Enterobacter TaxID=547 RepID=UPI0015F71BED|nr:MULTISPECIES: hypothetical protein [Enterobacter]EKS7202124.1 hypothetical protein [Enterobacter asburiae]ELQ7876391.1 hypothetical protein [Enterobacter asburiae]ELR9542134.1 hypothetical protein [Enterobacter asburiae]MDW3570327.1 hypothetical protein [Enterobacter asburiae]MDZ5637757.1 hypothetical protein [Enterobacter sp. A103]